MTLHHLFFLPRGKNTTGEIAVLSYLITGIQISELYKFFCCSDLSPASCTLYMPATSLGSMIIATPLLPSNDC